MPSSDKPIQISLSAAGVIVVLSVITTWFCATGILPATKNERELLRKVDSSLEANNRLIFNTSQNTCVQLFKKTKLPAQMKKAEIYYPGAQQAIVISQNLNYQLSELKELLKKEAGHKVTDGKETFASENKSIVRRVLIEGKGGLMLQDSLFANAERLQNILIYKKALQLMKLPFFEKNAFAKTAGNSNSWRSANFEGLNVVSALLTLTKLQNDVLISCNAIIDYSNNLSCSLIDYFEFYIPLVSQNATHLADGETLEITAGIGSFSSVAPINITINGKKQEITEGGFAVYKTKVGKTKGSVPITISYLNPNTGERLEFHKTLRYTVSPEKNN